MCVCVCVCACESVYVCVCVCVCVCVHKEVTFSNTYDRDVGSLTSGLRLVVQVTTFKGELGNSRHFFAGFHFCRCMFSQRAPPTGLGRILHNTVVKKLTCGTLLPLSTAPHVHLLPGNFFVWHDVYRGG